MWAAQAKVRIPIPLENIEIPKGTTITITHGIEFEYMLWHPDGKYDLPSEYVDGRTITILSDG